MRSRTPASERRESTVAADGTLLERVEDAIASLLRLPAGDPEPPPGSGQVRVFRAAPRYFHYSVGRWVLSQVGAIVGLGAGFGFLSALPPALGFLRYLELIGVAIFLMQLPLSFGAVWLDFNRRRYLVTDRSLRIREGVWTLHERTMSFANVQNLEVRQGPIWRLLGIAALEVRSAGGGSGGATADGSGKRHDLHVAYFRGVDNAAEIRDLILARLRSLRGAGLGDLDEEHEPATAGHARELQPDLASASPTALAAARELLDEARALRRLLA
jgi:membrane protein YdbS with pleckstrin-like domain